MPSNRIAGSYGGFIPGFYFLFIPIYFSQWDETLALEILFQKKHTFINEQVLHITTPNQRRHIYTGNDEQPPVFHTDTSTTY